MNPTHLTPFDHKKIPFDHTEIPFDHTKTLFDHTETLFDHKKIPFDHKETLFKVDASINTKVSSIEVTTYAKKKKELENQQFTTIMELENTYTVLNYLDNNPLNKTLNNDNINYLKIPKCLNNFKNKSLELRV